MDLVACEASLLNLEQSCVALLSAWTKTLQKFASYPRSCDRSKEKLALSLLLPQQLIGIEESVFVCLSYRVQRLASLVYHETSYENITSITYHTFLQTA